MPLAFAAPPPAAARKATQARRQRRAKQAPLRTCGQCLEPFRSWKEDGICGRCLEDGTRRPKPQGGPSTVALGGLEDDGSFHFLATGEPEPRP